jgi:hypothetical protein
MLGTFVSGLRPPPLVGADEASVLSSSAVANLRQEEIPGRATPTISDVQLRSLSGDKDIKFQLAILVDNLPANLVSPAILLKTKDPAHPVENVHIISVTPREILIEGSAAVGTEVDGISLVVNDDSIRPKELTITAKGFSVLLKANPIPSALKTFTVKLDHQKNSAYPNLHTLVLTKEGGANDTGFDANANHMFIELIPAGTSDVRILESNEQQMDIHFLAAADYEPKNVIVTVYDSSDLDRRRPVAIAKLAPDKAASEDPDQPKVDAVDVLFLIRSQGFGRLRIIGKGFGEYDPPPYPPDDYLAVCLERPALTSRSLQPTGLSSAADTNSTHPLCGQERDSPDKPIWERWLDPIRKRINVSLASRNLDLRVEKTEIININDKMIDVYFEFTRYQGYSEPFRLGSVYLTIEKTLQKTKQAVQGDKVTGVVTGPVLITYNVPHDIGPKPDPNLSYKYTVLDSSSANTLLGRGVSKNFYVLEVSVVNNGSKKVMVPLAAIQAEVQWARGSSKGTDRQDAKDRKTKISYIEGPVTLAPIPLASVAAYFAANEKFQGRRAVILNALDGVTTLGAALVPFAGPSFKDAHVVFTGGFIPGIKKIFPDISGEQLQNLTALSWQTIETIAPGGGTIEKLVYIQRKEQFADRPIEIYGTKQESRKQITNLMDLEITGYDVLDTPPKQAAASQANTQNSGTTSGSTTPAAPPATPPSTNPPAAPPTVPVSKPAPPKKPKA